MGLRVLLLPAVCLAGCNAALMQTRLEDLEHKLEESQRNARSAQARAEALEDKVFLLTDQLESQKVASVRREAPQLPVVVLHPAERAEEEGVGFEGAARSNDPARTRPHLVLGGEEARARAPVKTMATRPNASENLGVAPVPSINAALQQKHSAPQNNAAPAYGTAPHQQAAASHQNNSPPDPLRAYRDAYEALRAGRHDEAARAFRDFIRRFPEHDYADNAQYWLGECFYGRRMFVEAANEFRVVVTRFPFGNKAPDALLKLAFCLISLGDAGKARAVLAEVPRSYPRTEAARLATERLEELARVAPTGGTQ